MSIKSSVFGWLLVLAVLFNGVSMQASGRFLTFEHSHEAAGFHHHEGAGHQEHQDSDDHDDSGIPKGETHKHQVLLDAVSYCYPPAAEGSFFIEENDHVALSFMGLKCPEGPFFDLIKPPQIG